MQELYDRRTLHSLLGLKSQPSIVNGGGARSDISGSGKPSSSSARGAESVRSAWREAEPGVEDVEYHRSRRRRSGPHDGEEEDGRYSINKQQPPTKRRKIGKSLGTHTVFTTDEEEDGLISMVDSLDEEEGEYASASDDGRRMSGGPRDPGKVGKHRSYWLSKAIGIGEDDG